MPSSPRPVPLLDGVRWAERSNEWVGAHPATPGGRALIGGCHQGYTWQVGRACGDLRAGDRSAIGRTAPVRGQVGPQTRLPVAELRRHDLAHATDYVATLRAWLEAQGDPAQAGERLGVHENTVRNRLRKMAEITNLPLDDARKWLAMMIELAATDTD